jgi:hypothetical protein
MAVRKSDVTVKLPTKLDEQYKFIEALEKYVYDNPKIVFFGKMLAEKRIPYKKLMYLAESNPYVADKLDNIRELLSYRWEEAWCMRDSDFRENAASNRFRFYNKEHHAWMNSIEASKKDPEQVSMRQPINVCADPVENTEAVNLWMENAKDRR